MTVGIAQNNISRNYILSLFERDSVVGIATSYGLDD
jgi:hypothetical protein